MQGWLQEIVDQCGKNGLNPSGSTFCIFLFSSLDEKYVTFFQKKRKNISSYSGENVHIFTPVIYNDGLIPDGEWLSLREKFSTAGIGLGSGPSVVLFRLRKSAQHTGYDPAYFGAFNLPERKPIGPLIRDFVSACISNRFDENSLVHQITLLLGEKNLIDGKIITNEVELTPGINPLNAPSIFLSYSHDDSNIVSRVYSELKNNGLRVWLDRYDLAAGSLVAEDIERGLRISDAVIMFLSANSARSSWLPFEGAFFHGAGPTRPVIPIVLDVEGKALASRLPVTNGRLYIDMSDHSNHEAAFVRLAEQVKRALHIS